MTACRIVVTHHLWTVPFIRTLAVGFGKPRVNGCVLASWIMSLAVVS
jgi:hypothetical protein